MRIKVDDEISKVVYPLESIDVVGWKGDLTVWKLNMRDIRPIMSHRAHLPPERPYDVPHRRRVVCSFLPRPLEQDPEALRVPSSTATPTTTSSSSTTTATSSQRQHQAGIATLHPRGIHHGPHPKALAGNRRRPTPTSTPSCSTA